jgi:hypothetical protein
MNSAAMFVSLLMSCVFAFVLPLMSWWTFCTPRRQSLYLLTSWWEEGDERWGRKMIHKTWKRDIGTDPIFYFSCLTNLSVLFSPNPRMDCTIFLFPDSDFTAFCKRLLYFAPNLREWERGSSANTEVISNCIRTQTIHFRIFWASQKYQNAFLCVCIFLHLLWCICRDLGRERTNDWMKRGSQITHLILRLVPSLFSWWVIIHSYYLSFDCLPFPLRPLQPQSPSRRCINDVVALS